MPNKVFHLMASVTALGNRRGEVMIYSTITPYKWRDTDPEVTSNEFDKKIKELGDVDEILVRINSPGGSVWEATAIRTILEKHPAKKSIDIEGLCASAATIIACIPGAKVRMAKGGEYMIHRCSSGAWGHADAMLAAYNSMTATDSTLADYYSERTGKTAEECLELMKAETWYTGKTALEAGFVDELIEGGEEADDIAACAVDEDTMELMKACYANTPEEVVCRENDGGQNDDSNGNSAVAADGPSVNNHEGVNSMDELRNATAERKATLPMAKSSAQRADGSGQIGDLDFATLQAENPALAQSITNDAISAERNRIKRINSLTRKGAKWEAMAKKAIEDGTSVEDFLTAIIAEEQKAGTDYLEARQRETAGAGNVGGGDSGDHDDDVTAKVDKAASDIASLMKGMNADGAAMA